MAEKKYTDKQIAKLKDLYQSSHKSYHLGNSYFEKAKFINKNTRNNCAKLNASHAKLGLIHSEMIKQVQLIGNLLSQLRSRNNKLISSLEKIHHSNEEVIIKIDSIFDKLKSQVVDANLAFGKTLYDFVDIEAVETLKTQASQELTEMKNIQVISEDIITAFDKDYNKLLLLSKESANTIDFKPSFGNEKVSLQLNELNSISAIMISVSAQYDRVNHLYHNMDKYIVDLTALERRTESELSTQVSKIFDSLQRIENSAHEIDIRVQKANTIFRDAVVLLNQLEQFGISAKTKLIELDALEINFEERREGANYLCEELGNLSTWYDLFFTAYHELIFEIARRKKEESRQREIVETYQRELNLLWSFENQKREHFFDYYGRYLPQSLCPAIMESSSHYQIIPDHFPPELPAVAETERPSKPKIDLELSSDQ